MKNLQVLEPLPDWPANLKLRLYPSQPGPQQHKASRDAIELAWGLIWLFRRVSSSLNGYWAIPATWEGLRQ